MNEGELQQEEKFSDLGELDTVSDAIKGQEGAVSDESVGSKDSKESKESKSVLDDVLPDEFKGKTPAQIAKEALFYRSQMGKQANELGEVRRLADELIKSQMHKPAEQAVSDEIDIFENPKEAVRRAIEQNPLVQSAAMQADQARKVLAQQQLLSKHPDAFQLIQDADFSAWVGKSRVRQELLQRADKYDIDSADELFSTYKELKSAKISQANSQISDAEKQARGKAMNSAGVDSGGSGEASRKIFRRTDIMKLMTTDRRKYDAMQDEIMRAYAEGRVR